MNEVFGLNERAWDRWVAYRKQIKKPYRTPFAIEQAQKKLAGFGEYQMEVVERSMTEEWRGLFPLPKAMLAELEKKKRDESKRLRDLAALAERARRVGFREPMYLEDVLGYQTLVERAEHLAWSKSRGGPRTVGELLGAMK